MNKDPFTDIKSLAEKWDATIIDDVNCDAIKSEIFFHLDRIRIGYLNMQASDPNEPILDFCVKTLGLPASGWAEKDIQSRFCEITHAITTIKKIMRHDRIRLLPPNIEAIGCRLDFSVSDKHYKEEQSLWEGVNMICDAIICQAHAMTKLVYYDTKLKNIRDTCNFQNVEAIPMDASPIEAFYSVDNDESRLNDSQKLYAYALQKLSMMKARRYRGNVVVPRIVRGQNTTTYKLFCSIDLFLTKVISREYEKKIFRIFTSSDNTTKWTIKMLKEHHIEEFKDLVVDRRKFAFRNGIYDCQKNKFTPYNSSDLRATSMNEEYGDQIDRSERLTGTGHTNPNSNSNHSGASTAGSVSSVTTTSSCMNTLEDSDDEQDDEYAEEPDPVEESFGLNQDIKNRYSGEEACNYFDLNFQDLNDEITVRDADGNAVLNDKNKAVLDGMKIPTPHLDKLIHVQKFNDDVKRWYYACIGRMIYNVGELDGWELIPFHKGVAGTGKSTILYTMKMIYDTDDVGIMSNNIEGVFGLGALYDKFIVLCFEMRSNFNLDQAVLQSMISGEEIGIPIKHKSAVKDKWTPQIAAAGNMTADWSDSQGAIARRFLIFEYMHKVLNADAGLMKKIRTEMGRIICKCNIIYRQLAQEHGETGPWTKDGDIPIVLPQYFHDQAHTLKKSTNSLLSFILESGMVIRPEEDPDKQNVDSYYMRWDQFVALYKKYCRDSGSKQQRMTNEDQYRDAFVHCGLVKEDQVAKEDPTKNMEKVVSAWVVGCRALNLD